MAKTAYISVYRSRRSREELLGFYDRILRNWPNRLLFHGTGNNSLMWRFNVAQLGEHFRLHLVDTVNDPGKALLVGHSKGGWIVLNAAIGVPARVEKVVLLAPAVGINSEVSSKFMMRSLRVGLWPTRKAVSGPEARISTEYAEYLAKVMRGTTPRLIRHRRFSDEELKSIDVPVLLAFGDHEVCVDFRKVVDRARTCPPGRETGNRKRADPLPTAGVVEPARPAGMCTSPVAGAPGCLPSPRGGCRHSAGRPSLKAPNRGSRS